MQRAVGDADIGSNDNQPRQDSASLAAQ
jgi:hypothetical protein